MMLAALPGLAVIACAVDEGSTSSDDVTSVENTGVKSQAIGNCWLYATAGWAESLHKGATARDVDLSEAYWNYWYWFEQISGGDVSMGLSADYEVTQGAWWGVGAELIHRYGWMYEGDFIPDSDAKAKRHEEALAAINESLSYGALQSPANRRDPKIVRAELDKAWKLGASVVEDLGRQFPVVGARAVPAATDGGANVSDGGADAGAAAPPSDGLPAVPLPLVAITERAAGGSLGLTRIHAPQEMPVIAADGVSTISLADVVGTKAEGTMAQDGERVGPDAWTEFRYTWEPGDTARRDAFLKNVQNTLNQRLAVPIAWAVSSTAAAGEYHAAGTSDYSLTGLHASILVDYEVDEVPGFGTLRVDVREARPEALEATLAPGAKVKFFRIKNSWGVDPAWTQEEMRQYGMTPDPDGGAAAKPNYLPQKPGFNDLFLDYLDLPTTWGNPVSGHIALRFALPARLRFEIPPAAVGVPSEAGAPEAGAPEGGTPEGGASKK